MPKPNRDRVFLSYAHEDLNMVRRIYTGLKERQLNVWLDKENLGPGRWKPAITKAIAHSRFFLICISQAALRKTGDEEPGFQDEELNTAYNIAQEQPDKEFAIVPVRLEDCGRGDFRLASFQQYDLFDNFDNGLDKLAIDLGGISLTDTAAQDERTADEKKIDTIWGRASAAYFANNFTKALTLINSILEIEPKNLKALTGKGASLSNLGRNDEALAACEQALEIKPDHDKSWYNKGAVLHTLGRPQEALVAYDKALKINPYMASAWNNKGLTLDRLGRYEEALFACDNALKFMPDDTYAWTNRGVALNDLGRHEEALVALDKALEINPKFEYALIMKKMLQLKKNSKIEKPLALLNLFKNIFIKP